MATMIRGIKGSGSVSSNRIRLSVEDRIQLLDPNENPMTLLTNKFSKIAIGSNIRRWLTDVIRPEATQVNGAHVTATTTITVDNGDYFAVQDLWRAESTGEIILVGTVSTTNSTIIVTRDVVAAGSSEPGDGTTIPDDDWLVFIGNALEEGTTAPTAMHTLEVEYSNYTQIQRTPLYLTNSEIAMLMYGEQDLPYEVRKKGIEHARKEERKFIWGGKPLATTGGASMPLHTSAGLWWFLRKYGSSSRVTSQTEITEAEFQTWLMHCFRYGSSTKYLFAPPLLLEGISRWAGGHLQLVPSDKTFGVNINKWVSPHGIVNIVNHKMLEGPNPGTVGGHAFLLDMDDIKMCYLKGRDTALLTGREANDADSKMQEYLSETTMQIGNFDKHGYLYGFTSFAA